MDVIDTDKLFGNPFVVGALGALVALKFAPGGSWLERLANVVSGSLAAGFLTPALVQWLQMDAPSYASGAAFVVGLLGMSVADAIVAGIRETPIAKIVTGWLSRRQG